MGLPQNLKNAEMWPIKAKGKVTRLNPLGDPKVEHFYHKALEPGRHLETSLGDANNMLAERKREVLARIALLLDVNKVAVNAQYGKHGRRILLAANSIAFLKEIASFQSEIVGLIAAVTQNIGMLQSMEQNMTRMVQANLNAIANILNNICNWGLPDLPAIPNFFSDTIWQWNGFNFFPLASFQPHIGFDKNFAFNQCVIHAPNLDIFRNYPSTVQTYSGLQYGTSAFVPPLDGAVFGSNFNSNSSMLGSVPDPNTITNDYQMPAQTYQDNIVSIVPATRDNVVEPGDADYSNPDLAVRQPKLRTSLVHFVTLQQIVASNFDPNLTAEWLFYLGGARTGRGGVWIQNFQAVYNALVAPSVSYLTQHDVPWNSGALAVPVAIPLIDTLKNATNQLNLLWKLSYVEASLLGYTRTKDWDGGADLSYLNDFTKADLDYRVTTIDPTVTATMVLGADTAQFPVVCTFPAAIAAILTEVIIKATADILNALKFQSPHPQFRFTYNSFAVAVEVDRFTQFWREFNSNLQVLLVQDPYLVGFTTTYKESLDSAVNPLGDPTIYSLLKTDVASRSRTWTPGTPLLTIPVAPNIKFTSNTSPTNTNNGWSGNDLDAVAFLSRPDIQGQPIPVQIAMLRTNLSYAGISRWQDAMLAEIQSQLAIAAETIVNSGSIGFQVEITAADVPYPQVVPVGSDLQLAFDKIDFDITGNVVNPTTFVIQSAGAYAVVGEIVWDSGLIGVRTVTIYQNGNAILSVSTNQETGPITLPLSYSGEFALGDEVVVKVSHSLGLDQNVLAGSMFSMVQQSSDTFVPPLASGSETSDNTSIFVAGDTTTQDYHTVSPVHAQQVSFSPLPIVVHIDGNGKVVPLDPTTVIFDHPFTISSISGDGTNWTVITSGAHGLNPGDSVSILDTANFNGTFVLIAPTSGSSFTIANTSNSGSIETSGTVLAGNVVFPFADGIILDNAVNGSTVVTPGDTVDTGIRYGGVFQIPAGLPVLPLTKGGLIYARPGGVITQDYDLLITQVQWIVCVGRAATTDTFIWEPHVPQRFNMVF